MIRIIEASGTPTRPRATTARRCFAEAFSKEINEQVKIERDSTEASTQMNLPLYCQIRDKMYDAADDETRAKYEEEAKTFNASVNDPPTQSQIYV